MLLTALTFAVALRYPQPPPLPPKPVPPIDQRGPDVWPLAPAKPRGEFDGDMNRYRQPARCGPMHEAVVRHVQTASKGRAVGKTYAVMRRVDGCAVPSPMGYRQDYLLPGAADPKR